MALIIKNKGMQLLENLGCSYVATDKLKQLGATISKNVMSNAPVLYIGNSSYQLNDGLNADVKGINEWVTMVLTDIEKKQKAVQQVAQAGVIPAPVVKQPVDKVVPLRDAEALHQRVVGTSTGSTYVVVALSDKQVVKVAAKIEGEGSLSVRVEGPGLAENEVVAALIAHGLTKKTQLNFTYMSGHYQCDSNAPAAKVLGSILLGCGLTFSTPFPNITKVVEGSA